MEDAKEEQKNTGYKIENIFLIESSLNRKLDISYQGTPFSNEINIDKEASDTDENHFVVFVTLDFKARQDDEIAYSIQVKIAGLFERQGDTQLNTETFKSINAPAILYPFIREHVSSLTLKAGIGNVLLPAVNFKI